jgi:hypothetical protein
MRCIRLFTRIAIVVIAFIWPATAMTLHKRDMQAIAEAFDHIFTGIDNMIISLNSFNGDPASVQKIVSDNTAIRNAVTTGSAKVQASEGISMYELIHIGGPLFVMENKISELIETLHSQKAALDRAGAGQTILKELQNDKVAVDELNAVIGKNLPFPQFLGMLSDPIGKLVTNKLNIGIKEWGGQ